MNKYLLLLMILVLFACNDDRSSDRGAASTKWFDTDTLLVWDADALNESRKKIYQPEDSIPIIQPVINGINQVWPEGQLKIENLKNDTLYVRPANSEWVTEKIGDTGAEQYLSFAAMNLLEVKGVRFVCFSLPEGSHATSSCWSQEDFRDWKE
jgi:hypothetical protein